MLCERFKLLRESWTVMDSNRKALLLLSLFSVPEDRHLPSGWHRRPANASAENFRSNLSI
jgi:hypothetical protein